MDGNEGKRSREGMVTVGLGAGDVLSLLNRCRSSSNPGASAIACWAPSLSFCAAGGKVGCALSESSASRLARTARSNSSRLAETARSKSSSLDFITAKCIDSLSIDSLIAKSIFKLENSGKSADELVSGGDSGCNDSKSAMSIRSPSSSCAALQLEVAGPCCSRGTSLHSEEKLLPAGAATALIEPNWSDQVELLQSIKSSIVNAACPALDSGLVNDVAFTGGAAGAAGGGAAGAGKASIAPSGPGLFALFLSACFAFLAFSRLL